MEHESGAQSQSTQHYGVFARLKASVLCARDTPLSSTKEIIGWWESRRIPFNLIVGSAGILTCTIAGVVAMGSSILFNSDLGIPDPPLLAAAGILVYGTMANVCFTGGWLVELAVQKIWPLEANRFAILSFSLGLVFSILLTLAPGIVVGSAGIFGLVLHLLQAMHKQSG